MSISKKRDKQSVDKYILPDDMFFYFTANERDIIMDLFGIVHMRDIVLRDVRFQNCVFLRFRTRVIVSQADIFAKQVFGRYFFRVPRVLVSLVLLF